MIDITEALAGIVANFECTLDRLRDEAEAARKDQQPAPIAFGASYDEPDEDFWPPRIVRPANELRAPTQVRVEKSGLDEDEMFRWQQWRR